LLHATAVVISRNERSRLIASFRLR
jgi:hypothetical protein